MSDRLAVTGFESHDELDRFVRAEIRYFRSRDMRVVRCEAPAGAAGQPRPVLVFTFRDRPDLGGAAASLAAAYPGLSLAWTRGERGEVVTRVFEAGAARPQEPGPAPGDGCRELEEIYGTF